MSRARLNAIVDIASGIIFLIVLCTGIISTLILPSGGGYRGGLGSSNGVLTFLGVARKGWIDLHIITTILFVGMILIHLALHWAHICNIRRHLFSNRKEQGKE